MIDSGCKRALKYSEPESSMEGKNCAFEAERHRRQGLRAVATGITVFGAMVVVSSGEHMSQRSKIHRVWRSVFFSERVNIGPQLVFSLPATSEFA